jgi:uncharacterized protein with PQ loop repeat
MNLWGMISQIAFMLCLLPQPIMTYRVKHVRGVSLGMWYIQVVGYIFGLVFGLQIHQFPLILGSVYGMLISVVFMLLYWKYRKN